MVPEHQVSVLAKSAQVLTEICTPLMQCMLYTCLCMLTLSGNDGHTLLVLLTKATPLVVFTDNLAVVHLVVL